MSDTMSTIVIVIFGLIALAATVFGIWYERGGKDEDEEKS